MSTLLDSALEYLKKGLSVIPCKADKKPFIKWEEFQKRRPTADQVRAWWLQHPNAMIGIVTGSISGVVVIDIDLPQGHEEIQKYLPDSLLMPTAQTPRGGQHLYFQCPSRAPGNNSRIVPGCDFRGEGGYVIAPPSANGTGKAYTWMPGLSLANVPPPVLPESYLNKINNSLYKGGEVSSPKADFNRLHLTSSDFKMFEEGTRDNDLFHTANCLVKGGMPEKEIFQVLKILADSCSPPFPEKEIHIKIESAIKRAEKREINFSQEVRDFIVTSSDFFLTSDVFNRLQVTSRQDKKNVVLALLRLHKEGVIERGHGRDGMYRRVENQAEEVNFLTAPTADFPITWPLGVHSLCTIYPGNIVIVAGSKSAGKTAFLLNTVNLNQARHEIIYLNSEMGDTEFRKRLELFENMKLADWKFKPYHRMANFEDLITGEKKVFIIDFLEVTSDFWKVAQYIQRIHRKLKIGIAIIALQKSDAKDAGRGGDFSKEKSRLYLAMDYLPEKKLNRIKIVDAKAWRRNQNPRGMFRHYKLVNGSKFKAESPWEE